MRFVSFDQVRAVFEGKHVAIVGSGPGSLQNAPGFVDSHEVVVRVNNHKTGLAQGFRTDVHHSFYGNSIKKGREELAREGVFLCMNKCPDSKPIESEWHERMGKHAGIDFRYIHRNRAAWWFCDTFVPDDAHFLVGFELLERHIPTSGFAAILDVLACAPASLFLTGFDFFSTGVHNVDERWKPGNPNDPICHRPDLEMAWIRANAHRLTFDNLLTATLAKEPAHD